MERTLEKVASKSYSSKDLCQIWENGEEEKTRNEWEEPYKFLTIESMRRFIELNEIQQFK